MKIEEAIDIIDRCPYDFDEDEIEFDPSELTWHDHFEDRTCAMEWISVWKTLPPRALLHDPSIQTSSGMTCAMYWIYDIRQVPPQCLIHNPSIQDHDGMTCAMTWIRLLRTVPPQCLIHDPSIQNNDEMTCADIWKRWIRTAPPRVLFKIIEQHAVRSYAN